ncbi:putative methyltransferase [Paenibacillus sp. TCA20]|uniref:hypothetical protein n=1 Tax=Paenibacillus sp. TCA20 TaxID=1499968 RepID=UPI0004D51FA6|nr:hypothetical protein [Paenibacillus sp. TCA20]GAK42004.1 putative methyltransferase [Paenibacillus sp. TCA20]
MGAKPIKRHFFTKDSVKHYSQIQRTGDILPKPARIIVSKDYWSDVGGWRGWETISIYDKKFEDWEYAYAVYDEILRRADPGSVKER